MTLACCQAQIDCPTGLAGNMVLAALFDLGLPRPVVEAPLAALGLAGAYRLEIAEARRAGFRGLHLEVRGLEPSPPHRHWSELRRMFESADWDADLQRRVLEVFTLLADAEACVHGTTPERVHFHEVGAIDAIVDIVGVCAGLLHFGVEELVCAVPPAGHGTVHSAHGLLPLPAPAVLEIARRRAVPLASSEGYPAAELTTPTGLALAACWATRFGPASALVPLGIGVGLGSRELDRPNLLRITLGQPLGAARPDPNRNQAGPEPSAVALVPANTSQAGLELNPRDEPTAAGHPEQDGAADPDRVEWLEPLLQQQAQIDDATAEDLAFLVQALREAGAVEVFSQAISMKKGRQGTLITALLPPSLAPVLRQVWWQHSTTLGVREQLQQRWCLPRRIESCSSELGPIRVKRAALPGGGDRLKLEHDDLVALARQHNLSLREVRAQLRDSIGEAG